MDTERKIKLLREVDLFKFFEDSTLRHLCENCGELTLSPNEVLIKEGSTDDTMYLILSGELIVYKGIKKIAVLGPAKFLGEMSLIESKPRSATVKAKSDALLMEINENNFKRYLASESQALIALLRTLSGRIRNNLDHMSNDMQKLNIFIHDMNNFLTLFELGTVYLENFVKDSKGNQKYRLEKKDVEKIKKAIRIFNGGKDGLKTLIEQGLSQVKESKLEYRKSRSRILPLIRETIKELNYHKNLKGKHLKVKAIGKIPELYFNCLDIKRVLQNLIINAGFVSQDNGKIEVNVKENRKGVVVSVIDHGCGIPEGIRPFLFQYPITTKKDGNGLGLLSCKDIVEKQHNGKFWFDTEVNKGTTFSFMIPIN